VVPTTTSCAQPVHHLVLSSTHCQLLLVLLRCPRSEPVYSGTAADFDSHHSSSILFTLRSTLSTLLSSILSSLPATTWLPDEAQHPTAAISQLGLASRFFQHADSS